jgi:GT2 family glycosyltransferase
MQAEQPRPITVSIVSHGQQALLLPLLEQLETHCAELIDKVVLTVNISEQEFVAGRVWNFPLERVTNARPRGFGENHNVAFTRCHTPWFLVLNPDMRLAVDVLTPMLTQASADSGVLAPRVREPGKPHLEPHRGILTPKEILLRRRPDYIAPQFPAWIPGMFMLFRAPAYASVNGFDQRYFMYGEDFDICARLRLAGWRLTVFEELVAIHDARRASHRSLRHLCWHVGSLFQVWSSKAFWKYLKTRLK